MHIFSLRLSRDSRLMQWKWNKTPLAIDFEWTEFAQCELYLTAALCDCLRDERGENDKLHSMRMAVLIIDSGEKSFCLQQQLACHRQNAINVECFCAKREFPSCGIVTGSSGRRKYLHVLTFDVFKIAIIFGQHTEGVGNQKLRTSVDVSTHQSWVDDCVHAHTAVPRCESTY